MHTMTVLFLAGLRVKLRISGQISNLKKKTPPKSPKVLVLNVSLTKNAKFCTAREDCHINTIIMFGLYNVDLCFCHVKVIYLTRPPLVFCHITNYHQQTVACKCDSEAELARRLWNVKWIRGNLPMHIIRSHLSRGAPARGCHGDTGNLRASSPGCLRDLLCPPLLSITSQADSASRDATTSVAISLWSRHAHLHSSFFFPGGHPSLTLVDKSS